ncbi:hypothetical protein AS850_01025 [Frondihabitans sp. 762G35]|nr:hypothetical protein AS850_01025 [Frondihabitans sp. 762G35]
MLTACTSEGSTSTVSPTQPTAGKPVFTTSEVAPLVAKLPQRSIAPAPTMRLANGLKPPTNKWFSGLVFGAAPSAVFPFPLSFQQTASGFSAGLPAATSTTNTVFGAAVAQVSVDLGATSALVSRYDTVSVTIEYRRGSTVLGHVTIAEGSPQVSFSAATAGTAELDSAITSTGTGRGTVTAAGRTWGVVTTQADVSGSSVSLRAGGTLVLFPVPDGASAAQTTALMSSAAPLEQVSTSYGSTSSGQQTTLAYRSTGGGKTLVVPLPHQGGSAATAGCTDLSYVTLYGTVPVCASTKIVFTTPTVPARAALDLSTLTAADRAEVGKQLTADVAAAPPFAADTYFGGKTLYRSAMLLSLARELGDKAAVATLTSRLTAQLDKWTEPGGCTTRGQECFVYDPRLKSVVGLANSFGSEVDNDHHFHYGYFLYAAGVVAQDSPKLAARWAPVMNLLAADIATHTGDESSSAFLDNRAYDPYFSHSWASGYSEFADGNNQESSSEAVNAWAGLELWAGASGDRALAGEAAWLLSNETASALAYYVNPDLSGAQFDGFSHSLVSLNWGAKRDFATWFSAAPSAIVGIQLIPMSPTSSYLASKAGGGSAHIAALSKTALAEGADQTLVDYVLMYQSLAGPDQAKAALAVARKLPAKDIDNGDSRAYLLAYILANAAGASK